MSRRCSTTELRDCRGPELRPRKIQERHFPGNNGDHASHNRFPDGINNLPRAVALAFPRRAVLHPVCASCWPSPARFTCSSRRSTPLPIAAWIRCRSPARAPRAKQQIAAALASLPGSKLFVYEIPREPDDAVRVHVYSPDGTGRIVYVHPESLAILKSVPHTTGSPRSCARFTASCWPGEPARSSSSSPRAGPSSCWSPGLSCGGRAIARGAAGVLYPRLRAGRRVFWRDLHAVTGIWVSAFAMFLLITALPWTTVWGAGLKEARELASPPAKQDWSRSRADEHAEHQRAARRRRASPRR